MNYLYIGRNSDLNVGNGKTVSAVGATINEYLSDPSKTIFSNIKLFDIEYMPFYPENIGEVLETKKALVILDELHAIVHKNHKINERCTHHSIIGLCYRISEFYRQVRKRDINSRATCQTFSDAPFQYRQLMQEQILCEKYRVENNRLFKCDADKCPAEHEHIIKQTTYRNLFQSKEPIYFDPAPYYNFYDSFEIVEGWVSYE